MGKVCSANDDRTSCAPAPDATTAVQLLEAWSLRHGYDTDTQPLEKTFAKTLQLQKS